MQFGQTFQGSFLQIAGTVFTDLANLIVLRCQQNAATTWSTPRQNFGTAGYVVPASKSLRILAIEIVNQATAAALDVYAIFPAYCDNDTGMDGTTAATNETKLANMENRMCGQILHTAQNTRFQVSTWFEIPTGKYIVQKGQATQPRTYYTYFGYLV